MLLEEFCDTLPPWHKRPLKPSQIPFLKTKIMANIMAAHATWPSATLSGLEAAKGGFRGQHFTDIPKRFRDKIEKSSVEQRGFQLTIDHHTFRIYMVSLTRRPETFYREAIHKIYLWLSVLVASSTEECNRDMNVYIYLLPDKKVLPKKGQAIGVENVNTAFTRSCDPVTTPEINIFREEEWFKVLIHETFHNHGLDFSSIFSEYSDVVQDHLRACFPALRSEVLLFESYCEFWANLLHTILAAFVKSGYTSFYSVDAMYERECAFTRFQCVHVLRHYDLTFEDLLTQDDHRGFDERQSNVFAYFVIRCVMMHGGFLEWHLKHNGPTLRFLGDNIVNFSKWLKKAARGKPLRLALRETELLDLGSPSLRMVATAT